MKTLQEVYETNPRLLVYEMQRLAKDIEVGTVNPGVARLFRDGQPCCALGHLMQRLGCDDVFAIHKNPKFDQFQAKLWMSNDLGIKNDLVRTLRELRINV